MKEKAKMKDVESQKIDMGGGTTTYIAAFRSKSGTPFENQCLPWSSMSNEKRKLLS
jgi:hypothetical protein